MDSRLERIDGRAKDDIGLGVDWVQKSFQTKNSTSHEKGVDLDVMFARVFTTAMMKFTDTTPGGNLSINPLPQPSVWTDPPPIRDTSTITALSSSTAQGSYYSEMYDDNQQIVYFRFGVPVFNSLTGFYTRFYNSDYARLVRTGGGSNTIAGMVGHAAGSIIGSPLRLLAFTVDVFTSPFRYISSAYDYLTRKSSSLYYFKPTMPLYWAAAQSILNHIAVNKGFLSPQTEASNMVNEGDPGLYPDSQEIQYLRAAFPDIVTENGNINLYGMATRAQRQYNAIRKEISRFSGADFKTKMVSWYRSGYMDRKQGTYSKQDETDLDKALAEWFRTPGAGLHEQETQDGLNDEGSLMSKAGQSLGAMFKAGLNEGAEFVGFRVNHTGAATESFTNSFRESEIGQWINSTASQARSTKFSLNHGNIGDGMVSNFLEAGRDAIVSAAGTLGDSLGISSILGTLMGNAYVDIPKFWDKGDVSFPTKSYTIDLISPSGDVYSQIINIYTPLSMLLAGAMMRSTGRHSYTEPFLCQVFDKGRAQTRLGMIRSLSIQRGGNGNVSWTDSHEPLNIRVTVEVEDMESSIHMPMVEKLGSGTLSILGHTAAELLGSDVLAALQGGWFTLDNAFTDYMAVLGSLDLTAQIYITPDILRKWRVNKATADIMQSDAYLASGLSNNAIADVAKMFMQGTFSR